MIDMGKVKGERVFYTEGETIAQLVEDGELIAIPDPNQGIIYKRPENCSKLEMDARLTISEAIERQEKWKAFFREVKEGKL